MGDVGQLSKKYVNEPKRHQKICPSIHEGDKNSAREARNAREASAISQKAARNNP